MGTLHEYIPRDAGFSPDVVKVMTHVYDRLCTQLQLAVDDPLREAFATKIIGFAAMGERDPETLIQRALASPLLVRGGFD